MSRRFVILRRALDAEMKAGTRDGLTLKTKRKEKLAVTEDEEQTFWQIGLLGKGSAKSLLNTVYYYNGKLFGLRGGEHRNIVISNFEIGDNFIRFEENVAKTFHGGLGDLKYEPRVVKHICHAVGEKHEPCLVDIYQMYIELVRDQSKGVKAFYLKPNCRRFAYDKLPVGINSLNEILPSLCKAGGFERKTSHSLRVTCAPTLFYEGVEEKLIRDRTGHRSNALYKYEKCSEQKAVNVSTVLAPKVNSGSSSSCTSSEQPKANLEFAHSRAVTAKLLPNGVFTDCTINVHVNDISNN